MKNRFYLVVVLFVSSLLASCASGPGFAESQASLPKIAPGKGRIFFYRPSSLGFAVKPPIHLDSGVAGRATAKGFSYQDVAPGAHTVELKTEVKRSTTVNVTAGQPSYVRIDIQMGLVAPRFTPVQVSPGTATAEIAKCKLIQ
jgi:hypothetical protein